MKQIEETPMNWEAFDMTNEDRLKLETGKKYELGFSAIRQGSMEVTDKEKTAEGSIEVKKSIPTLILAVDYRDGKPAKLELIVTSKRFAQDIRTYFQKKMLFERLFEISREGEGVQTKYRMIALDSKPGQKGIASAEG